MVIVAAVDADQESDPVVAVGQDLAEAYGDDLVVLYVMTDAEFERRRKDREYFVDAAVEDAAKTARWVVDGSIDDGADVEVKGRVGEPVDEILAEAEKRDARFLVVGGRKRTPVGKAIFGSVTQTILIEADRSVVTVLDGES